MRRDDLNHMLRLWSTQAITKELVPIREEMETLNERLLDTTGKMKDALDMQGRPRSGL